MTNNVQAAIALNDLPRKKSMGLAILLVVVFGWLGVLYASVKDAFIGFFLTFGCLIFWPEYTSIIVIVSMFISWLTAFTEVRSHNNSIDKKRRVIEAAMEE